MPDNEKATIAILLACYNGEKFIADQLHSLISQSYTNWKLFIRDDNSTDDTTSIIKKYVSKDDRIFLVNDDKKNLGSCQNFATLLNFTKQQFQYVMFCDQDDFWLPFKIEETLGLMKKIEKEIENNSPVLVYTNFLYVDSSLKVIESKKNFQATKVNNLGFPHLLAQNPIYGCTMMMNMPLAETIRQIPVEAENHDYWVALVASAFGRMGYLNKQTILYRQHENNISTNYDSSSTRKRLKRILLQGKNLKDVQAKRLMAEAFKNCYYNQLSKRKKKILDDYLKFFKYKSFYLLFTNLKHGIQRQKLLQTILFYTTILFLKGEKM